MSTSFAARGGWWVAGQVPMMLGGGAAAAVDRRWISGGHCAGQVTLGCWSGAVLFGAWGALALGHSLTPLSQAARRRRAHLRAVLYRYVRHPIYSAVLGAAAGWALAWQSLSGASGSCRLFFAYFDLKARREERWLAEKYPHYGRLTGSG